MPQGSTPFLFLVLASPIFSFLVSWVLPSSMREMLTSGHQSFLGKEKEKGVAGPALLCLFLDNLEGKK